MPIAVNPTKKVEIEFVHVINKIHDLIRTDLLTQMVHQKGKEDYKITFKNWMDYMITTLQDKSSKNINNVCIEDTKIYIENKLSSEIEIASKMRQRLMRICEFMANPRIILVKMIKAIVCEAENNLPDFEFRVDIYKARLLDLISVLMSIEPTSKSYADSFSLAISLITDLVYFEKNYKFSLTYTLKHLNLQNAQRFFTEAIQKLLYLAVKQDENNLDRSIRIAAVYFRFKISKIKSSKFVNLMKNFYKTLSENRFDISNVDEQYLGIDYNKLRVINTIVHLDNIQDAISKEDILDFLENFDSFVDIDHDYYPLLNEFNFMFSNQQLVEFDKIPDLFVAGMMEALLFLNYNKETDTDLATLPQHFENYLELWNNMPLKLTYHIPVIRLFNFVSNLGKVDQMNFSNYENDFPAKSIEILSGSACSNLRDALNKLKEDPSYEVSFLQRSFRPSLGSSMTFSELYANENQLRNSIFSGDLRKSAQIFDHILPESTTDHTKSFIRSSRFELI